MIGIVGAFLLICAFVLFKKYQPKYPPGKIFEHSFNGFKARVIIDHNITSFGKRSVVSGIHEIDGLRLAESCAISMEAASYVMQKNGLLETPNTNEIDFCVFWFQDPKSFDKLKCNDESKNTINNSCVVQMERGFRFFGKGPYMILLKSSNMYDILERGQLAVHEMIHVLYHASHGDWDKQHELWENRKYFYNGKNINRQALDLWRALKIKGK